ncbi:MAG: DEAD/DEAH box helicase family protein [Polyangiaceae bacterium]|nr:DEAD/DEAH box helicase family protein [Polyangiaceae bacterium]MBK8937172.1 DEAD/DEAH box helicase family protein [Polyangiaceae bacterium]
MSAARIEFHGGTLRAHDLPEEAAALAGFVFDERQGCHRARGIDYRTVVTALTRASVPFTDEARGYRELDLAMRTRREPYPHQAEALAAWRKASSRGVVVLPTGAGKTFVAALAIAERKRSALVVVPTLDLMAQWHDNLAATFEQPIGLVGGGSHEVADLTVTTYDSAHLHMDRLGNRFGLVIFDECHHLPSDAYATAARMCLAPFRLGLTATPERNDGREGLYDELVGPICYRRDITELSGIYLAPYETVRLEVPLSEAERAEYTAARAEYTGFLRSTGIDMSRPDGWGQFLLRSSLSDVGRRAFLAYRAQRRLALAAPGKIDLLERLLRVHKKDRVLVFTEDNATVYEIAKKLLLPAITHQTRVKERSRILAGLASGELFAVVTSKVLNEGVDVPSANVAIVLSGNGSVREHVQRLGRILRKQDDKSALLYELVSSGTSEQRTSDRRREHVAYK